MNLSERKTCYRIFSQLFAYPEESYLDGLEESAVELMAILELSEFDSAGIQTVEDLAVAHTELFINRLGGTPAPPYGSVYLDPEGQLMGESSRRVLGAYNGEGLNLDGSSEPPDYLSTELEFLYYLLEETEAALAAGTLDRVAELERKQVEFIGTLLLPWLEPFCQQLLASGGHPYYLWLAAALLQFSRLEQDLIQKNSLDFPRQLKPHNPI